MTERLFSTFKRHEIYVVATLIGIVFITAMGVVAWLLRSSITPAPYELLSEDDLKKVFTTAYLRFREDDGTPYLKMEIHNGTLWWIKKVEFEFDGVPYDLSDSYAFRPLRSGALRLMLKKAPPGDRKIVYDIKVTKAFGYPPANGGGWVEKPTNTAKEVGGTPHRY